jgi:hypothetical protein
MKSNLAKAAALAAGTAALLELGYFCKTWLGYGKRNHNGPSDTLLDKFMPAYEVAEQHQTSVKAPASVTFEAACDLNLQESQIAQLLFKTRSLFMRETRHLPVRPSLRLRQMEELGWRILAEEPGRQIVLGAVARPWARNSNFEPISREEFAEFSRPGFAKIVFSLAVQEVDDKESTFYTKTRVITTDSYSRERFRVYWAAASPGIVLIRRVILRAVKQKAEERFAFNRSVKSAAA